MCGEWCVLLIHPHTAQTTDLFGMPLLILLLLLLLPLLLLLMLLELFLLSPCNNSLCSHMYLSNMHRLHMNFSGILLFLLFRKNSAVLSHVCLWLCSTLLIKTREIYCFEGMSHTDFERLATPQLQFLLFVYCWSKQLISHCCSCMLKATLTHITCNLISDRTVA